MDSQPHDGELLKRFSRAGDESTFQELLNRHARMVFQVCYRVLGNAADAEDATQAVFLTLAQRANDFTLQRSASLGGWLHTLALRVAMRLRSASSVRRKHEQEASAMNSTRANGDAATDFDWEKLRPMLDEALAELPEKYRLPFVLCHLEEHSHEEAAALLATPKRTVTDRLERARELLRKQLEKRGVVLSVGILATLAATHVGGAELPAAFVATTAKAASLVFSGHLAAGGLVSGQSAALTHYASKMLLLAKIKTAAMIAVAVGLAAALGVFSYGALAAKSAPDVVSPLPVVVQAPKRPAMKPKDIPDEKPKANADPAITPRTSNVNDVFKALRERGIRVLQIGQSVELQVPVEFRFVETPASTLVNAIASSAALKVSWINDGTVAVMYPGEPDVEFAQATKDLESADASVRQDATWRLGDMWDIRAMPLLLKLRKDADAEVARLARVGMRRLGWGVAVALDESALADFIAALDSRGGTTEHWNAILSIQRLDGEKTAPLFERMLADPDYNDLIHGDLIGIQNLRGEKALPLLEKLHDSSMENLRVDAVYALGFIPGEKARALIESRFNDPSENVQDEAVRALRRHGGETSRSRLKELLLEKSDMLRLSAAEELAAYGDDVADAWLAEASQSPDAAIRAGAMNAWGRRGGERALIALEKALSDPDTQVHDNAVYAFGQVGGEKALTILAGELKADRSDACRVAAYAISNIGGDRAVEILEPLLKHKDNGVRYDVIPVLLKTGSVKTHAAFHAALNNSHEWTRKRAVLALASLGDDKLLAELGTPNVRPGMGAKAFSTVMHTDPANYTDYTYRNGFHSFDSNGNSFFGPKALPILERALASKDNSMPMMAVQFARDMGARKALPFLKRALDIPDKEARSFTIYSLSDVDGPQAVALLLETLNHPDLEMRKTAATCFAVIGGAEGIRTLKKLLTSKNADERVVAIQLLGNFSNDFAAAQLEKFFVDPDPRVRKEAARYICVLDDVRAVALAKKALTHPDASIREGALLCLSENHHRLFGLAELAYTHGDIELRKTALEYGSLNRGEKSLIMMEKALLDPEWSVRVKAVDHFDEFCRRYGATVSLTQMAAFRKRDLAALDLALSDSNFEVRKAAATSISTYRDETAHVIFARAFTDIHPEVRAMAAYVAFRQRDQKSPGVLPLLEKALADPDVAVRSNTAYSLGRLGVERGCALLLETLKTEPEERVKKRILSALKENFAKSPGVQEALKAVPKAVKPTAPPEDKF